jgi:hypothetical protein
LIEQATDHARPLELPPKERVTYRAFIDASGGRRDHYAICIGHKEGERFIVDVIRGKAPPFDPALVTKEFAQLAREYGVHAVIGDAYSGEWVRGAWREQTNGLSGIRHVEVGNLFGMPEPVHPRSRITSRTQTVAAGIASP